MKLGVDSLTLSAHKVYGPKGVGGLYVRPGVALNRQVAGGGQERLLRAGTENVAGIAGMAAALRLADGELARVGSRLIGLRAGLWKELDARLGGLVVRNSPADDCLPGTLNISILGQDGRALVRRLDELGFAISAGSACTSSGETLSHVLEATFPGQYDRVSGAIRISLGRGTTYEECSDFAEALTCAVRTWTTGT